jgi:hypothetical protein
VVRKNPETPPLSWFYSPTTALKFLGNKIKSSTFNELKLCFLKWAFDILVGGHLGLGRKY